jgi:hypothetical protein
MPSYPPIRARVTEKAFNLPPYPREDKKKIYAELPPIRARVTENALTYPP